MNHLPLSLLLLLALAGTACREYPAEPLALQPAFYHWKSRPALGTEELAYLDSLGVRRLYLRFFDVGWDPQTGAPAPLSLLQTDSLHLPETLEVVPVVFLTEDCMARLDAEQSRQLAVRVAALLLRLAEGRLHPSGYQFDCDWTASSRAAFFRFLEEMDRLLPAPVSVTLRLHQLRWPASTGVPPADRAMLMFYNMGKVTQPEEKNSILNLTTARPYLEGADPYPLPLDLALPLFQWGVVFRQGTFSSLINDLEPADLADSSRFSALAPHRYAVRKSTYLDGDYLYEGDAIRLEAPHPDSLARAARLLAKSGLFDPQGFQAYYHLSPALRKKFPHATLQPLIELLRPSDRD